MDVLQIILLGEGKFNNHNYLLIKSALEYKNTYLTDKDGDLFSTVYSLITLNNIITDSQNITLRDINVKPAGYDKTYMNKSLIEPALYQLVDEFNERKLTHKQFCNIFLNLIHSFRDGNGRTCKTLFADQINNISTTLVH